MKKENVLNIVQKLLIIFFIGAIVGFCYEVIFYYFTENRLDNAGVLYGPWLPIYGAGAVLIYLVSFKFKKNPLILFLSCILITGLLEYIIGYIDFHIFHQKLWDYTNLFLNINGYVCLRSVLSFAIGGLLLIYVIDPILEKMMHNKRYYKIVHNILIILVIVFILDIFISRILHHTPFLY